MRKDHLNQSSYKIIGNLPNTSHTPVPACSKTVPNDATLLYRT